MTTQLSFFLLAALTQLGALGFLLLGFSHPPNNRVDIDKGGDGSSYYWGKSSQWWGNKTFKDNFRAIPRIRAQGGRGEVIEILVVVFCTSVALYIINKLHKKILLKLCRDFQKKFPGRCMICSYHEYGVSYGYETKPFPKPHNCIEDNQFKALKQKYGFNCPERN